MITTGKYREFPIGLLNRNIPDVKATVLSDIVEIRAEWITCTLFCAPFSLFCTPLLTV